MSPTVSALRTSQSPRKPKEAKNFIKSEAELADVMDTLQRTISIIEKEIAKYHTFLQKEIGTRNTNYVTAALITKKTSKSLQQTVLMLVKRTTEKITDVSSGNTAALVGIAQFLGSLALRRQLKMLTTSLKRSTARIPSRRSQ